MKTCQYCSEIIQDTAKKCRYCGEWLEEKVTPQVTDEGISFLQLEKDLAKNLKLIKKSMKEDEIKEIKKTIGNNKKNQWTKYIPTAGFLLCLGALGIIMDEKGDIQGLDTLIAGISTILTYYIYTGAQDRVLYDVVRMREYGLGTLLVIMLAFYIGILPEGHLVENPLILMPTLVFGFFYFKLLFSDNPKKKL